MVFSVISFSNSAPYVSILIPTFNRCNLILQAIDSALNFGRMMASPFEIVIVDDCSTDGTVDVILSRYEREMSEGVIRCYRHECNRGVTAAKNSGARMARGGWLMFLDSDDELMPGSASRCIAFLRECEDTSIVFFRVLDRSGQLVGPVFDHEMVLNLEHMLRIGTPGECIPVIKKDDFLQQPYDEDLRGHEGLAYCKIIKRHNVAIVSPLAIRVYRTEGEDRLSDRRGLRKRACLLARGHFRMLRLFFFPLGVRGAIHVSVKVLYHTFFCLYQRFSQPIKNENHI